MASDESSTEIKRTTRDVPPANYILKIKSFSQFLDILRKKREDKYESDEFEASDYKWKLVVYPNGNAEGNGEGHVSMYIASTDKKAISSGCHVNAVVNFFIYDHIRDRYLTVQDGKSECYHVLRTEHGFDQLLSLTEFTDASNGYLVNDCCAFGVEVHVIKNTVKLNEFSVIKDPTNGTFTWKIDEFSTSKHRFNCSDTFHVGGYKWKLHLYPKGDNAEGKDEWLSLYLKLDNDDDTKGQGVYAECTILIKDQIQGKHHERILDNEWFRGLSWGYPNFMLLRDVNDALKGFLVNDTVVIEAKITLVSAVKDLS